MSKLFRKKIFIFALWFFALAAVVFAARWAFLKYLDYKQEQLALNLTLHDKPFSSETLLQMARSLAKSPYIPPKSVLPPDVDALDYDQHRAIRFVRENGPWYNKKLKFEMQFFHLGSLFKTSIPVNEIINGKSHPISYSSAFFDYGKNKIDTHELKGIGYAAWCAVERMHPEIQLWETFTPYFETRNIHFYVNRCGFKIVEYFNNLHPLPEVHRGHMSDKGDFRFEKRME